MVSFFPGTCPKTESQVEAILPFPAQPWESCKITLPHSAHQNQVTKSCLHPREGKLESSFGREEYERTCNIFENLQILTSCGHISFKNVHLHDSVYAFIPLHISQGIHRTPRKGKPSPTGLWTPQFEENSLMLQLQYMKWRFP